MSDATNTSGEMSAVGAIVGQLLALALPKILKQIAEFGVEELIQHEDELPEWLRPSIEEIVELISKAASLEEAKAKIDAHFQSMATIGRAPDLVRG